MYKSFSYQRFWMWFCVKCTLRMHVRTCRQFVIVWLNVYIHSCLHSLSKYKCIWIEMSLSQTVFHYVCVILFDILVIQYTEETICKIILCVYFSTKCKWILTFIFSLFCCRYFSPPPYFLLHLKLLAWIVLFSP